MARLEAPLLDAAGRSSRQVKLEPAVFGAEIKPHLVHEAVRAELAAARSGTRGGKSRGMVSGGRSKPWRQKGTGRARAGSTRAPQWTGGGAAFPPQARSFTVKVNRKVQRSALRAALTDHAERGTLALVDGSAFERPSTKQAAALAAGWGKERPLLVIAQADEESLIKSFRNLERVSVVEPAEVEVTAIVWARSLVVSEAALEALAGRAA